MRWFFPILISALGLVSCSVLPPFDPMTAESFTVQPATDATKTLTVKGDMVFYSDPSQAHGIRFPPGTYALEAEDSDYWYFRSPSPLEFRDSKNGAVTSARGVPGGIMLPRSFTKSLQNLVAAAGYTDGGSPTTRNMVWKLGVEFRHLEGTEWTMSF
jgi:hypothetical protein